MTNTLICLPQRRFLKRGAFLKAAQAGFPGPAFLTQLPLATQLPQRNHRGLLTVRGNGNRATDLSESHPGGEAQGVSEKKKRRKDREVLDENVKSMITAKPLRANKISGAGSR